MLASQAFANVLGQRSLARILADPGETGDAALSEMGRLMAESGLGVVKLEVIHIEQSEAVEEDEDDLD